MTQTPTLTVGIELEFIVFYIRESYLKDQVQQYSNKPEKLHAFLGEVAEKVMHDPRAGPILFMPPSITLSEKLLDSESTLEEQEAAWVRRQVAEAIASTGPSSKSSKDAKVASTDNYSTWNVVPDASVGLPLDIARGYEHIEYCGVEVTSPVFPATEASFREIQEVIRTIRSCFRTAVPPVCGLHVHVGRDRKPLDLRTLQRVAGFLWIAEPFIDRLHPGCRIGNEYCLGLAEFSNLAKGMTAEEATLAPLTLEERRHAPILQQPSTSDDSTTMDYAYDTESELCATFTARDIHSAISRALTRNEHTSPSRCHGASFDLGFKDLSHRTFDTNHTRNALEGVEEVFRATDARAVAELMAVCDGQSRGSYNFANNSYIKDFHGTVQIPEGRDLIASRKPTIEFRQAAGSLDESWVVLWARVCLAICGMGVVDTADEDFFALIKKYESAPFGGTASPLSVFDLLWDIGMNDFDIIAIRNHVSSQKHEQEPLLKYCRHGELPLNVGYAAEELVTMSGICHYCRNGDSPEPNDEYMGNFIADDMINDVGGLKSDTPASSSTLLDPEHDLDKAEECSNRGTEASDWCVASHLRGPSTYEWEEMWTVQWVDSCSELWATDGQIVRWTEQWG